MKKINIIYWVSTAIFCAFIFLTGISYFTDPKFVGIYSHMGFPQYFRIEVGAAKIIGALLLIIPQITPRVKEWGYAAFGVMLISGAIAHINSGDPLGYIVNVIVFFAILVASYIYWHKRTDHKVNIPATLNLV